MEIRLETEPTLDLTLEAALVVLVRDLFLIL